MTVLRAIILLLVMLSVSCSRAVSKAGWMRTLSYNTGLRELARQKVPASGYITGSSISLDKMNTFIVVVRGIQPIN